MSALKLTKSRQYLLLIVGVFVLPVILAKLALNEQWFSYGVTNQGDLMNNHLTLADLGIESQQFNQQWLMLVSLPEKCETLCQNALLTINNAYVLLGKEMPRVTPVALTHGELTEEIHQSMHHTKWQSLTLPTKAEQNLDYPQLLIIDPLSNVVLSYKFPTEQDKVTPLGNAIIADMKKLLKYSRIG